MFPRRSSEMSFKSFTSRDRTKTLLMTDVNNVAFVAMLASRLLGWACWLVCPPLKPRLKCLNCHDILHRHLWSPRRGILLTSMNPWLFSLASVISQHSIECHEIFSRHSRSPEDASIWLFDMCHNHNSQCLLSNISPSTLQVYIWLGQNVHGFQLMYPADFGDPLDFPGRTPFKIYIEISW